jgi:ElaA protein
MSFHLWSFGQHPGVASDRMSWRLMAFADLRVNELYEVLRLRSEVFVLEQQCLYLDIDGDDRQAMHVLGVRHGQLLAYARCFGPGVKGEQATIGRVLTHASVRGKGLGHELMEQAITAVSQVWGPQPIRIGAQQHLVRFYADHGFQVVGEPYLEDGIAHVEMLLPDSHEWNKRLHRQATA